MGHVSAAPGERDAASAQAPRVSVVMPFRDAAHTLGEALDSVQAQRLEAWELIAIDDGSSDASAALVRARARGEPRIRLMTNPGRGLVAALNAGLHAACAPLVARMDADDRMRAGRLAAQAAYLERHPDVTLVASRVRAFPADAVRAGMRAYLGWQDRCRSPRDLREEIYLEAPFAHPSVMYRRERILQLGGYRAGDFPEDYDLWLRLAAAGDLMAKLPRALLEWRQRPDSLSRTDPRYARDAFDRLRAAYLARDPRLATGRPLVLWGAGRRTRQRARWLQRRGFVPSAWVDIDPRKIGYRVEGAPVVAPEWLRAPPGTRPFVLVYVAVHGAREHAAGALRAMGYARGRDYLMVG